jgi:pimeloyl-ACP methyl ester carboxylesterase
VRIHYREEGNGMPVLLIHGFCETHEIWQKLITPLSSSFRVVAVDLPGFGQSTPLKAPHSIDDAADALVKFIRIDLGLTSCVALGHSLGGYVTLSMVERRPELFRAFGLIHSTAYADTEERKNARNKVIEFVETHGSGPFIRSFIPPLFADPSNAQVQPVVDLALSTSTSTIISYAAAMCDRPDRTHVLRSFAGPILFQAGEKDSLIPLKSVEQQSLMAKKPTLSVLQGAAHMGMMEQASDSANAISAFLHSV